MLIVCPHCNALYKLAEPTDSPYARCRKCDRVIYLDGQAADHFVFAAGQHVNGYRIVEVRAAGGMAAVYRGIDTRNGREVALKVLPSDYGSDQTRRERFVAEISALTGLDHPHIVRILDKGECEGSLYYVMEWVGGPNVRQLIDGGKLSIDQSVRIVLDMLDALEYLHARGMAHRDIKPSNILLTADGEAKLVDFGIVHADSLLPQPPDALAPAPSPSPGRRMLLGTPNYMAPEQSSQPDRVDRRSDLYSLGLVFYEMLTGVLPGKFHEPASRLKPDLPPAIERVLDRALAVNPEARYQTAREFADALRAAVAPAAPAGAEAPRSLAMKAAFVGGMTFLGIAATVAVYVLVTLNVRGDSAPSAVQELPQGFLSNLKIGRVFEDKGDLGRAITHYERALTFHEDAATRQRIRALEDRLKHPTPDRPVAVPPPGPPEKSPPVRPDDAQLRTSIRQALLRGDPDAAEADLKVLLAARPDDAEAKVLGGRLRTVRRIPYLRSFLREEEARWSKWPDSPAREAEALALYARDLRVACALLAGRAEEAAAAMDQAPQTRQDWVVASLRASAALIDPGHTPSPWPDEPYFASIRTALRLCGEGIQRRCSNDDLMTRSRQVDRFFSVQTELNASAVQDAAAAAYRLSALLAVQLSPTDPSAVANHTARLAAEDARCPTASAQLLLGLRLSLVEMARYIEKEGLCPPGGGESK